MQFVLRALWELAGHQQQQWQKVSTDRWLSAEPPACQWLATPLISLVFQGEREDHCQLPCLVLLVATCQGQHMVHSTYRESWTGDGCRSPTAIQGMPYSAGWQQSKCHTAMCLGALLRGHPIVSQKSSEDIRESKILRLCSVLLNTLPPKAFGNQAAHASNENVTLEDYGLALPVAEKRKTMIQHEQGSVIFLQNDLN